MKKIVNRYRISKFQCFMNGMVFAMIAFLAILICIEKMNGSVEAKAEILLPFSIAIISLLLGGITMYLSSRIQKKIIKYAK